MISKACQYALRAVIFLASKADDKIKLNVKQIAKEIDAPEAFTAKTLQLLNKHKIITSLKGPYGGFFIEDYQMDTPIIDIVHAIDGLQIFTACGLGLKQCSAAHPCAFHDIYTILRNSLQKAFEKTTIRKLAKKIENGTHFLSGIQTRKK
jgi:Rrf2 family iron-sulfur cluster assembly transcriptional regulator